MKLSLDGTKKVASAQIRVKQGKHLAPSPIFREGNQGGAGSISPRTNRTSKVEYGHQQALIPMPVQQSQGRAKWEINMEGVPREYSWGRSHSVQTLLWVVLE